MCSKRPLSTLVRDARWGVHAGKARYADIIHSETMRLARLLDDLLDVSGLEAGRVQLNLRQGVLREVIDTALSSTAGMGAERWRFERDTVSEDVMLNTDADRLAQVFINLIANALKYSDAAEPTLRIEARQVGGDMQVDFIDNGSGISTDQRDVIFEKFARIGESKAGGAGLGLAICREVMGRLGGRIDSLTGHEGAAFRVQFPINLSPIETAYVFGNISVLIWWCSDGMALCGPGSFLRSFCERWKANHTGM